MKLFCAGVGGQIPRHRGRLAPIKKSEYDTCVKNGVKTIIEVPVGIDGLTIIEANGGPAMNLTQADIYKALAANPFGKGAEHGADLEGRQSGAARGEDPGPRPAADLRHARQPRRAYPDKGCDTDPAMKALKKSNEDQHKDICTKIREDGAYVEAGENDNLLVQKVARRSGHARRPRLSPTSSENADKVRAGEDRRRRRRPKRRSPT